MQHDEWVPQKSYPVEIKPRTSEKFFLNDMSTFYEGMAEILPKTNAIQRFRGRFLRSYVMTDDGRRFRVRLESSLRNELRGLRIQKADQIAG